MCVISFSTNFEPFDVSQVGHLGEAYQEWVHQPIVCVEGPRFFENEFWEVVPSPLLPIVTLFMDLLTCQLELLIFIQL